ncbi:MAG: helix-turn-helix transcriptional regulator [Clostridia bacterium]|nr:helix-turn-helix transcriptional regulator [Clostridia bacterium]
MDTQRRAAGVRGFDIEALERAVMEGDRERIHEVLADAAEDLAGASRLTVMSAASALLWELCDRGCIDEPQRLEGMFLEALRIVSLCDDAGGAVKVLERVFASLCGQGGRPGPRDADWQTYVKRAIEYMRRAYGDPGLKIGEVANYAYISTSYLTQLIKRETGRTFSGILTEIRLEQAARLLAESDRRTYEIAARCGFANATYFSTAFRRAYGMAPTEYRRRQRNRFSSVQTADYLKELR